ncbi:hypothetical protein ACLOJK_009956 [Asimina triloba]
MAIQLKGLDTERAHLEASVFFPGERNPKSHQGFGNSPRRELLQPSDRSMADIYQIFVKHLDGRTRCLRLATPTVSGFDLKQALLRPAATTPLFPAPHSVRLISGTVEISDSTLLSSSGPDRLFPSCALLLRLRGGKGGFGSLLRGAATKAGQKKTNNFDACRDMSGRRLRHVNAEKKLEEWRAEAEERKLEKIAEEFIKKKAKAAKKAGPGGGTAAEKYIEQYREVSAKCMEVVEESVRESFALYENGKRKALPSSGPSRKRMKIWLGKGKELESDSDDDDDDDDNDNEEEEKSLVIDDSSISLEGKKEGSSGSVSHSDGESSGGGLGESDLKEENGNSDHGSADLVGGSSGEDANSDLEGPIPNESGVCEHVSLLGDDSECTAVNINKEGKEDSIPDSTSSIQPNGLAARKDSECGAEKGNEGVSENEQINVDRDGHVAQESGISESVAIEGVSISTSEVPLNFDVFNSAAEMEVLGLDRLRVELQARGLKCGGTLQERAARLYLLKTMPIEKLPKKLLAKTKG